MVYLFYFAFEFNKKYMTLIVIHYDCSLDTSQTSIKLVTSFLSTKIKMIYSFLCECLKVTSPVYIHIS